MFWWECNNELNMWCMFDIVIGVFNVILLVLWLKEMMIDEF